MLARGVQLAAIGELEALERYRRQRQPCANAHFRPQHFSIPFSLCLFSEAVGTDEGAGFSDPLLVSEATPQALR
jgi:hypothetical protein